jgi:hypothetical protein
MYWELDPVVSVGLFPNMTWGTPLVYITRRITYIFWQLLRSALAGLGKLAARQAAPATTIIEPVKERIHPPLASDVPEEDNPADLLVQSMSSVFYLPVPQSLSSRVES